jgi:hypothetical protein
MVCKPKKEKKGELGITNLEVHNMPLLLKHLHKFYNNDPTPWVQLVKDSYYYNSVPCVMVSSGSLWWRNIFIMSDAHRAITKCEVGNGTTVWFGQILGNIKN